MFKWLKKLYDAITEFWKSLPDQVKEIIINAIVDTFEALLRSFYRNYKGDKND
jgi:hypothetical protein